MEKNKIIEFIITSELAGLRLDKALAQVPEIGTRSRAAFLISENSVSLIRDKTKKIILKPSYETQINDKFNIEFPDAKPTELVPLEKDLDIIFEDEDLIVVNKPAGLVVHPAAGHEQDTLVNALLNHSKNLSMKFGEDRPGLVHRIDKDTSGLLVIAKNDYTHEKLAEQFKNKTTHRIYWALCYGRFKSEIGTFQSYLARHPIDRKRIASLMDRNKKIIRQPSLDLNGKWAVTHYEERKYYTSGISLIHLKLETGRTHQIRVHLSEAAHPIVGDVTYGADHRLNSIKSQTLKELIRNLNRFALHAAELGFCHPRSLKNLKFNVNWPQELQALINYLEEK